MLIYMITVDVMKMIVMQIAGVAVMLHRFVPARFSMLMLMLVVCLAVHRKASQQMYRKSKLNNCRRSLLDHLTPTYAKQWAQQQSPTEMAEEIMQTR